MLRKKICMVGSFAVGKTSLVRRFVESIFSDAYFTSVGVKIEKKVVRVGDQELMLMIWDIGGENGILPMRKSYLDGASGLFLVADGTRRSTLAQAVTIREEAEKRLGQVPFILVFNKSDLKDQWEIDAAKEKELASSGWSILHTSAKTGEGVEQAFQALAQAILDG